MADRSESDYKTLKAMAIIVCLFIVHVLQNRLRRRKKFLISVAELN